ncbi:MAG: hypothetical protein AAGK04_02920 [Planctomycetota bacterium]
MGRRVRLAVWVALVLGMVATPVLAAIVQHEGLTRLLIFSNGLGALGLLWLLASTPVNAIKLSTPASHVCILAGFAVMLAGWRLASGAEWQAITGWLRQSVPGFIVAGGVLYLFRGRMGKPREAEIPPVTPWWSATLLWHPMLAAVLLLGTFDMPRYLAGFIALVVLALADRAIQRRWQLGVAVGPWRWSLAVLFYGAAAMGAAWIAPV